MTSWAKSWEDEKSEKKCSEMDRGIQAWVGSWDQEKVFQVGISFLGKPDQEWWFGLAIMMVIIIVFENIN